MPVDAESTADRAELLRNAREGHERLSRAAAVAGSELPVRYLRQQAHLTAPATDYKVAEKALREPVGVANRLLERYGIPVGAVADRLGVEQRWVEEVLSGSGAPLVVLDLEDGVPPHMFDTARANVIRLVREVGRTGTLCYVRPPEMGSSGFVDQLVDLLLGAGAGLRPEAYPIDGLVVPKVRHVEEISWLESVLASAERALGLEPNRVRVTFLIETAWGVLNLAELATAAMGRLSGLVLGTVDLSADVLLPDVRYRHPLCEWARLRMVAVAAAVGVPAIDGMTLDFPVPNRELDAEANRILVLDRMVANFEDALHSIDTGMAGRWVGHPLQLVATQLAFRAAFKPATVDEHVRTVEAFATAMAADQGAVAGQRGELLDIGTDRHLRNLLRRATAWGALAPARAAALGLVTPAEAEALSGE